MRLTRAITLTALALLAPIAVQLPAQKHASAVQSAHDRLVSEVPVTWTPQVLDGWTNTFVQVGDVMVAGGSFTRVSQRLDTEAVARTNVVAFDARSGALAPFAPVLDGEVFALHAGPQAGTVYIAGAFKTVNGVASKGIALVSLSNGSLVTGWASPYLNGVVNDITVTQGHLVAAGTFTEVGGGTNKSPRGGMASFSPTSGKLDDWLRLDLTEHHNYNGSGANAAVGAENIDLSPDGRRLVVIGNFRKAAGLDRDQITMLDVTSAGMAVSPAWATQGFSSRCSYNSFDSWVRDVEWSPDGSYFVVVTTGGPWQNTLCDTASRWEGSASGSNVQPTWVAATGGDTLFSVAVTGAAVYAGGHQRWFNNPVGGDSAGRGAVPRPGLVALDPLSGVPLSWNAARNPRGFGAFGLYATADGLWVASDTEWIGDFKWHRDRIAMLPVAGGAVVPPVPQFQLPSNVYRGPLTSGSTVTRFYHTGSRVDWTTPITDSGVAWGDIRGAFVAGPWLYAGFSDGNLYRLAFDGTSFGPRQLVDPYNDPYWSTVATGSGSGVYRGRLPSLYGSELASVTGMFYDSGRIYYTLSGSSGLYWRSFSAESGIVHTTRNQLPGVTLPTTVRGIFLAGGKLYYAAGSGNLTRIDWAGAPVAGTSVDVGGPGIDGIDWRSRALFVGPGPMPPGNQSPIPSIAVSCSGLSCQVDASGSSDPDGTISSYRWDFGDGTTSTAAVTTHTYGSAGTRDLTLTVTDNRAGVGTAVRSLTVGTANVPPTAAFTLSCADLDCTFNASGSSDSDGSITGYAWDFGDGHSGSGVTAGHTFGGTGSFPITLTVTDNSGATAMTTKTQQVTAAPLSIAYRAGRTVQSNASTVMTTIPAEVQPGDALLLFATANVSTAVLTPPAGWTEVGRRDANGMLTALWQRVAQPGDAGSPVAVNLGTTTKVDLHLAAYSGTSSANPVAASVSRADLTSTASHTTPNTTVTDRAAWVVSYWVDKSSSTTAWTAPSGPTSRSTSYGTGSGYLTSLLADSGPHAVGAAVGGLTATTDKAGSKATTWTVQLRPGQQ